MSDEMQRTISRLSLAIGVIAGIAGLLGAWFVLPYRMDAAETELRDIRSQVGKDHDLIQRIDERTARMEKAIDRLGK